eukprot:scaffold114200_cov44-Attheya_sp.AAC.2
MRGRAGEEQRAQRAERAMQDAAEAEEVEEGQFASERESGEGVTYVGGLPSVGQSHGDGDTMFPQDEYEEDQAHFNIGDETGPAQNTADMVGINDIDDMGRIIPDRSVDSRMSGFSLEPTNNDMENDLVGDEDAPRQGQGSELVSSSSKWHKNMVKTLAMLKRNMGSDSAEGDEEKALNLSYDKLSHGCSRRTAVGDESYGDILVAPGSRFDEELPTA